jgi:protein transport protein DSL1/ZW10
MVVSVRDSTTVISLSSVLSSLSATSLSNHLAVLRRDINAYYIDCLLTQPVFLTQSTSKDSSGISSQTLSLLPSPSAEENLPTRLKNLASVLDFLDVHLFAALPTSDATSFKKILCKPVTMALLQQFLIAHLPSTLTAMPPYLRLVMQANEFEQKYIVGMLNQDPRDREVQTWTDAVPSHYERRRRAQILEDARQMILRQDEDGAQIRVEVEQSKVPPVSLPNSAPATQSSGSGSEGAADVSDDAWGLEEEESGDTDDVVSAAEEEDAWGFDDAPTEPETTKPENLPEPILPRDTSAEAVPAADASAWGWDDSGEEVNPPATTSPQASSSDNGADWDDDPWGEPSSPSLPSSSPTPPAPKPASRLEKLANKAKAKATPPRTSSLTDSPVAVPGRTPLATTRPSEPVGTNNTTSSSTTRAPTKSVPQAVETYAISGRARQLADTVDGILREGEEFASTAIFDSKASATQQQTRGLVILQTAPAVLDLFRALYPVKFGQRPTELKSIVFANDCLYARGRALSTARRCPVGAKERLLETADSLEAIGTRWYEQCVVGVLLLIFVVL